MDFKLVIFVCFFATVYADEEIQLTCPPPTLAPVCEITCKADQQCGDPANELCCPTACGGTLCQRAATLKPNREKVKEGLCPANPIGPWICSNMCSDDSDCNKNLKCCKNKCGAKVCLEPDVEDDEGEDEESALDKLFL